MADFNISIKELIEEEGDYVNHPSDSGGETYKGISRRYHPNWKGWHLIDIVKDTGNFPKGLENAAPLKSAVKEFYLVNYWNKILGDEIQDQRIANIIFSYSVNQGLKTTVKNVQKVLGVVVDGQFGPNTLKSLNSKSNFIEPFKFQLIRRYIEVLRKDQKNFVFIDGWVNRLERA